MHHAVDEGDDAGGVWEDFVPLLESLVGGDDQRPFLVSSGDDCVFRAKLDTDSGANWTPVPAKVDTDSGANWTPVPANVDTLPELML